MRFPFGIPDGWFPVAYSDELVAGDVRRIHAFDRELVAFRTDDARVAVLDAYCPHLGAHLGVGGRVVGRTLRCPFHGWCFDASGDCVEVPGGSGIPAGAEARAWPVVERNGLIFVWHHAEGHAPDFEIPSFPEWNAPDWTTHYQRRVWRIRTQPQEVVETSVDWEHFNVVHGMTVPREKSERFQGKAVRWVVGGNRNVPPLEAAIDDCLVSAENWGLGFGWLRYNGMFRTVVATGITPIDRDTVEVRLGVIGKRDGRTDAATLEGLAAYLQDQATAMDQDVSIWENKCYRAEPTLAADDGTISAFRRWARQFYSGSEAAIGSRSRTDHDA